MSTVKENNWFWIVQRLGGKCARCGSIENLQVDHVDPRTKKFEVKSRLSYKRIKLIEEVDKCQLLCEPCHKDKTYNEDWEIIKEKKNDFLHADEEYLPLLGEYHVNLSIDGEKRDGKAYIKYVEFRAKKTGNTFQEIMVHDHIVHDLLHYVAWHDRMVNDDFPWLPDTKEEVRQRLFSKLEKEIANLKSVSQGLYEELYDSIHILDPEYRDREDQTKIPFTKVVDFRIKNDILHLCDKWIDITLTYFKDMRAHLKSQGF